MEQQPFEDISPIGNDEFPASHVYFYGGYLQLYRIYVWFRVRLSPRSQAMCQERVHLRLWDCSHWCSLSLGASVSLWNFNPGGSHENMWKIGMGMPFKGLVLAILVVIICNYREKIIWTWLPISLRAFPNSKQRSDIHVQLTTIGFQYVPFQGSFSLAKNSSIPKSHIPSQSEWKFCGFSLALSACDFRRAVSQWNQHVRMPRRWEFSWLGGGSQPCY